ncbi:MAG: DUF502 domain-containing protein [Planctomycetes bacterium]|nr:DUF502 domain-containing protein [Planctomycetota bacterium]
MADIKEKKNMFITGLGALLPTMITIFVIVLAFRFMYYYIAQPLGRGVLLLVCFIFGIPMDNVMNNAVMIALVGFPLAIIVIFFVGYMMATFLGRTILRGVEKFILSRFPVINSIYPYAKQIADIFVSDDKKVKFQKVVAVEYPRQGIYQIGFITSDGLKDISDTVGKKTITVFLPTSPTPFTGWTAFIPSEQVIPLSISVDEAIRILISGGLLIPPNQLKPLQSPSEKSVTENKL